MIDNCSPALNKIAKSFLAVNQAMGIIQKAVAVFNKMAEAANQCQKEYEAQAISETKLAVVMKQRMGALDQMIQSIKNLTAAQQQLGIYSQGTQLAGVQELATFTSRQDALEKLIPAMNDLIAQQKGLNASEGDFVSIADMMGKVLSGQTSGLSRIGYVFSEAEEQALKMGNEMERATTLANIITENVGHMNQALRETPEGKMAAIANDTGDMRQNIGKLIQPFTAFMNLIKGQATGTIFYALNGFIQQADVFIKQLKKNTEAAVQVAGSLLNAASRIAGAFLSLLSTILGPVWDAVASLFTFISKGINVLVNKADTAKKVEAARKKVMGSEDVQTLLAQRTANIAAIKEREIDMIRNGVDNDTRSRVIAQMKAEAGMNPNSKMKSNNQLQGKWRKDIANIGKNYIALQEAQMGGDTAKIDKMQSMLDTAIENAKMIHDLPQAIIDMVMKELQAGTDFTNPNTDMGGERGDSPSNPDYVSVVDKVKIDTDFQKILNAAAERQYQMKFNQVTPQLNIGVQNINNSSDVDNSLRWIEEATEAGASRMGAA